MEPATAHPIDERFHRLDCECADFCSTRRQPAVMLRHVVITALEEVLCDRQELLLGLRAAAHDMSRERGPNSPDLEAGVLHAFAEIGFLPIQEEARIEPTEPAHQLGTDHEDGAGYPSGTNRRGPRYDGHQSRPAPHDWKRVPNDRPGRRA